ncbi:MAG TPA: hypothetical protein VF188_05715 [Longimicrobiales bacterium]
MMRGIERTVAVARFELRRLLRSRSTLIAIACFLMVLAAGHWSYWASMPPRAADDRLFGYAYIGAMILSLRLGLAADRDLGLDAFLVRNFVAPVEYLAGKVLAVAVQLVGFGVLAFVAALALSAGEWEYATWYVLLFTLVAWLFLPGVLLAELVVRTRYPVAAVVVGFVIALAIGEAFSDVLVWVSALGLDVERFAYATLEPLVWRCAGATLLLVLLYPLSLLRLPGGVGRRRDIAGGGPEPAREGL